MPFIVKYVQDIPKNCGECPCSVHITPTEVYCNARQKHLEVKNTIPIECGIMECNDPIKECDTCKYHNGSPEYKKQVGTSCTNDNDCKDWNLWEAKE